jgi:hypothetical protein
MWLSSSLKTILKASRMFGKIGLALALCVVGHSAFAVNDPAPASRDELADRIKTYQTAKDCEGLIGLFYKEGADQARQNAFTQTIRDYLCANFKHKIASVTFQDIQAGAVKQPPDFNGTHSVYTLPPKGAVVIDYDNNQPGETKSISLLYGAHDDKTYLLTTKQAEAK